jgi:hypothetical protein
VKRNLYHTGIVVERLTDAMEEFAHALDVHWRPARRQTVHLRTAAGHQTVELHVVHSLEGPPYIELIECVPGTVWDLPSHGEIHHVGFSTSDLDAACSALEERGMTRLVSGTRDAGTADVFAYFRAISGPIVEVIDESVLPRLYSDPCPVPWTKA